MESYKTFLYAVRDSPALRVKYGYVTCPDAKAARKHLHSRYSTYYFHTELLHIVPVAQRGVDAEAQLKASLMPHYIGREFLMFADEDSLQAELRRAFEEATCDEEAAARRQSRRGASKGERKRVREEAELVAAVEVALIAKRRKLERREAVRERRRQYQRLKKAQAQPDVVVSGHLEVLQQWTTENVFLQAGVYLTREALKGAVKTAGLESGLGSLQLNRRLNDVMRHRGVFKTEHYVRGVRYKAGWLGVTMIDPVSGLK